MRNRIYVSMDARNKGTVIRRARAPQTPDELAPGGVYAIGPFRTLAAARICASGEHSPHVQTVREYEKVARRRAHAEHHARL